MQKRRDAEKTIKGKKNKRQEEDMKEKTGGEEEKMRTEGEEKRREEGETARKENEEDARDDEKQTKTRIKRKWQEMEKG